jgi:hypothetical protein
MSRTVVLAGLLLATASLAGVLSDLSASVHGSRYSDEVTGMTVEDVPKRPKPILELFQGYQRPGRLGYEARLPGGMILAPNLTIGVVYRNGIQAIDNGVDAARLEWVNALAIFSTLTINQTERLVAGISPLTENGQKTKYTFRPEGEEGWSDDHYNARVTVLFFEGDLSEMFPKMDWKGRRALDFGIAVGRQGVVIQDGFLIADIMDSVAITRNTVPFGRASNARYTFLYGWDGIHRGNNAEDDQAQLFGLFTTTDVAHSKIDFDMAFVDSTNERGDQVNIALSTFHPTVLFGTYLNTTFRVATSVAVDEETAQVTEGTLLYSSISGAPKGTHDIVYFDAFWAIDNYAPASRTMGGPLGRVGLLFSGNGLAAGSPISNRANDSYGGAFGYQKFFSSTHRRNLILEMGGRVDDSPTGFNAFGITARLTQAIRRHTFVSVDVFAVRQEARDNSYGLRSELTFKF